ncbi:MAG: PilN domain-containing protein [Proteobacteria bacterium]|nr:PilN domain-containing protein [Pseudomonadota bacterium]MBU1715553.1 PilN domain-containing protein [Pseudomonadota bacterium]
MIKINLLPVRQLRKKQQLRTELISFSLLMIAVIFIVGGTAIGISAKVSNLKKENTVLTAKKASYQPILNEIEQLKKDKLVQETKIDVIRQLRRGAQLPVKVLDEIAKITPSNRLWLKDLKQSKNILKISCIALDNATIAQYMEKITDSAFFASAELSQSAPIKIAGADLRAFSLDITINPDAGIPKALVPSQEAK